MVTFELVGSESDTSLPLIYSLVGVLVLITVIIAASVVVVVVLFCVILKRMKEFKTVCRRCTIELFNYKCILCMQVVCVCIILYTHELVIC